MVAVGDGALGFWGAVRDAWPETRPQRDWCHKMANVARQGLVEHALARRKLEFNQAF
jgi:transposase-like protein